MSEREAPGGWAGDQIARLGLAAHPEGGWYRRMYTSQIPVPTPGGERPTATVIHFLLPAGEASAWHVVSSDELWLWHGPGALALQLGGAAAEPVPGETRVLDGPESAQGLVPAGVWQRTLPGEADVLVSCLVSPGFDFADWRLADEA